jgi:hypothetical protein
MFNVQSPALECVFKCSKFNVSAPTSFLRKRGRIKEGER